MNPADILDDCLQRLQFGEPVESCLARYPDQAAELRPLLAVAGQARSLAGYRLSPGQRLRAKVTLRETLADRSAARSRLPWGALFGPARGFAFATILLAALLVTLTAGSVAASQPGDLAYRLRVVVERAPVVLQTTPERRATAELEVAERRLADLDSHLAVAGRPDETALAALLAGDAAAAGHASAAAETQPRDRVADRVEAHADRLARLAQIAADPAVAAALTAAAEREYAIAERLRRGLPPEPPADRPGPPRVTPTPTAAASVTATMTATATASPTPTATRSPLTATATPPPDDRPRPTLSPEVTRPGEELPPGLRPTGTPTPGWRATAIAETATARPTEPPRPPRPTGTLTPGWRATAIVETATAHPPEPPRPTGTVTPGWRATAIVETATAWPPMPPPPPIATRLTDEPRPQPSPGPGGGHGSQPPPAPPGAGSGTASTPAPAVQHGPRRP